MELVEKMTDDTKQAVRELREALAARAKDAEDFLGTCGMGEPPDDEPLLTASIRHLPAVLDRLEELEEALAVIRKIRSEEEPADLVELRDLARMSGYLTDFGAREKLRLLIKLAPYLLEASAERDAIRAKFAEFRAAVERIFQYGDSVLDVLDRFPALDSSETTDGREG